MAIRIDWNGDQTIPRDYEDDYLELIRLLTEAAGIEHSLMLAYLYAIFSVRNDLYPDVRGEVTDKSFLVHLPVGDDGQEAALEKDSFLDVALEEMQHLSFVNWFLVELGAAPNFIPHQFPFACDLYPFEIKLQPLDRYVAATYLWMEADSKKMVLGLPRPPGAEPLEFVEEVRRVLLDGSVGHEDHPVYENALNHIGSLYQRIIEQIPQAAKNPPAFLGENFPWNEWRDRMNWIMYQGEESHYRFFRGIFAGSGFGPGRDRTIWDDGPDYPAYRYPRQSAFTAQPNTITDDNARDIAWLGDLHYWIILALLDTAYRSNTRKMVYKAIDFMTNGLWRLGCHLASNYNVGMPFDPMGPHYSLGRSDQFSAKILGRLVVEAQTKAKALAARNLLPPGYDLNLFITTLANIEKLADPGALAGTFVEYRFG